MMKSYPGDNESRFRQRRDAAEYIAEMSQELAGIATGRDLEVLRYLLEMARDEARSIALEAEMPQDVN